MKRVFRGLLFLGVIAGAVVALKNFLDGEGSPGGEAQITFQDGSTRTLATSDIEGQEFVDLARKLVESGL